jgi:hypothetical protein
MLANLEPATLAINWIYVGLSALIGLLSAVVVDLDAYKEALKEKPGKPFNWRLALTRWLKGFIAGAVAAMGISAGGAS